ncbi:dTDP-4-dehydrorhamnose reductase [Zobellia barbeyronii]|uniref:dTDP-4-dehydrorhamnose reductase n=1 Tax=Zobellia barbeyronii TaxID=2748009 RepID=A0ABS5WAS1_9FLAO|nr:dTDP-4-dehydrorhamnose reductase [Zobellia barbeyronii]MBT2160334.1 dTDP-4-dehydrorhamnose reductase [Zobellia barbeyronii]
MKSVLVTGANGQFGKSIEKIAVNYPQLNFVFATSSELDITSIESIEKKLFNESFSYLINCAAYTDVENSEKEPEKAYKVNADGVKNLALICKKQHTVLIHVSTDYVFDGEKGAPYLVTDVTNPINVYGASKLKGEQHIEYLMDSYFIVRTSWLYSEFGKNFYKTIFQKAKEGANLSVIDDQIGSPTHAGNLAEYILNLIIDQSKSYGIHHFTDGEILSWYGFAEKILKENGLADKVQLEKAKNYRTFARRPKYSVLEKHI